jgi:hypothetical protein
MKQLYLILILTTFLFPFNLHAQQYLTERLVELTIETEPVQEYFEAFNTVFIQSNNFCNNNNCRAAMLTTNKKVMILNKDELFMRKLNKWMEFILIKRNKNKATVKIKLHKAGFKTLKYVQNHGEWYLK